MSIKIMTRVWSDSAQQGGALLILLALADWANDEGECFPAVATLAKKARLGERHVHRILKDLVKAEEIAIVTGGGRKNCNTYRVLEKKPCQNVTLSKPEKTLTPTSETLTSVPETLTPTSRNPDAQTTRTVIEPSIEPSINQPAAVAPVDDVPFDLTSKPAPKPRPRDPIWDALCKFQGYALEEKLNAVATGKIARAKKLILETSPAVTAEEIAARGTRCRAAWTGNDVMRLASDWSRWGTGAPQNAQNGRYGSKGLAPIR